MKRTILGFCAMAFCVSAGLASGQVGNPESEVRQGWSEDLADALTILSERYAYPRPTLDFEELETVYLARVAEIESAHGFFKLIEQLVEELHDHHAHLGSNDPSSFRLVPSGLSVWSEFEDGAYVVAEVRQGSRAESAGLRAGGELVAIDGVDVAELVSARLAPFLDKDSDLAKSWAIRTLLGGRHNQQRVVLTVANEDRELRDFAFDRSWTPQTAELLTHEIDDGGAHTVRIENSLGNYDLVAAFDTALDAALDAELLILDLTNTPGGGNSLVARGLMGRFTSELMPYQRHEFDERPLGIPRVWIEQVAPRGDEPFQGQLLILANHWTGSMGEGLTIGLDTLPNSTVIGTTMAGLKGSTEGFTLPHSGIRIFLPTEKLFHIDGYAREAFYPDVMVTSSPEKTSAQGIADAVDRHLEEQATYAKWQTEVPNWIASTGHELASVDPEFEDTSDLDWLVERTADIKVFAMGESTHGNSEFFRVRHRLTRFLIENAGFNVVAFEASAATARACDRYLLGEDVRIEDAMSGLGMAIWQVEELRDLLIDLRELNTDREHPIRFFGVDMQSPGAAVRFMQSTLSQVDVELGQDWEEPLSLVDAVLDGRSADHETAEIILSELHELWAEGEPDYRATLGDFLYLETTRQMRVLDQNLLLQMTSDWSKRDAAMAENTLGIFDVMGPDAKVLLWAHNGHVFKGPMTYAGTDNLAMGGDLQKVLGDEYYALGLLFDRGQFQANGYDENGSLIFKRYEFDPAPQGAMAAYFALSGSKATLLDYRDRPEQTTLLKWLDRAHGVRWLGGYNVPDDINRTTRDASRLMGIRPGSAFDGLLYLDQTSPATPLDETMIDERLYGD